MLDISPAIERVRRVLAKVGASEFARLSGVPYTTIRECESRDFTWKQIDTLQKLDAAAEEYEQSKPSEADQRGAEA